MGLQIDPFETVAHVWVIQDVTFIPLWEVIYIWHVLYFNLHAIISELAYSHDFIKAQLPLFKSKLEGVKTQTPSNPPELHATLVLYESHLLLFMQLDPLDIHKTF